MIHAFYNSNFKIMVCSLSLMKLHVIMTFVYYHSNNVYGVVVFLGTLFTMRIFIKFIRFEISNWICDRLHLDKQNGKLDKCD